MTAPTCIRPRCDRPSPDAQLCSHDSRTVEHALVNIAAYATELDTIRARQTRYSDRSGPRSTVHPLPFDPKATVVELEARNALVGWIRHAVEERGVVEVHGPTCRRGCAHTSCWRIRDSHRLANYPADTIRAMTLWLTECVEWFRHQPEADEWYAELTKTERELCRLIDRPADRWYAGRCSNRYEPVGAGVDVICEEDLYADAGAHSVRCRTCGADWDVPERRAWLLEAAEDVLATKHEIASAVPTLAGVHVTVDALKGYIRRGRLLAHGTRDGQDTYRIGDVLDLLMSQGRKAS